jgi:hypothetical protein
VRTLILTLTAVAALALPASALATTETASAGGVTATLSFTNGPGINTTNETLTITAPNMATYHQTVPHNGCFKVCSPLGTKGAVHVVDLYGDGEYEVVLDLFTGGASCCGLEQVYVPSASIGSWVMSYRNFGQDGGKLEKVSGKELFLSGDNAFECEFTDCAATVLPIQIVSFTGDAFHVVTKSYPALIKKDAAQWLRYWAKYPANAEGLVPAWAADEDNLGLQKTVATKLAGWVKEGQLTQSFVNSLQRFLKKHGY